MAPSQARGGPAAASWGAAGTAWQKRFQKAQATGCTCSPTPLGCCSRWAQRATHLQANAFCFWLPACCHHHQADLHGLLPVRAFVGEQEVALAALLDPAGRGWGKGAEASCSAAERGRAAGTPGAGPWLAPSEAGSTGLAQYRAGHEWAPEACAPWCINATSAVRAACCGHPLGGQGLCIEVHSVLGQILADLLSALLVKPAGPHQQRTPATSCQHPGMPTRQPPAQGRHSRIPACVQSTSQVRRICSSSSSGTHLSPAQHVVRPVHEVYIGPQAIEDACELHCDVPAQHPEP
jgi:hypothetical protein